jgi:hypothetical protein
MSITIRLFHEVANFYPFWSQQATLPTCSE